MRPKVHCSRVILGNMHYLIHLYNLNHFRVRDCHKWQPRINHSGVVTSYVVHFADQDLKPVGKEWHVPLQGAHQWQSPWWVPIFDGHLENRMISGRKNCPPQNVFFLVRPDLVRWQTHLAIAVGSFGFAAGCHVDHGPWRKFQRSRTAVEDQIAGYRPQPAGACEFFRWDHAVGIFLGIYENSCGIPQQTCRFFGGPCQWYVMMPWCR